MGTILNWEDLITQSMQLYEEKCYAESDAMLAAEGPRFPERKVHVLYNRVCMNALMGKAEQAIALLGEAIDAGMWYRQNLLREDADLASLQGVPEFERLAAICLEREEAARAAAKHLLEVAAPEGPGPFPALLALHGNNSTVALSMRYWKTATEQGVLAAMGQSTQPVFADFFVWDDAGQTERDVKHYVELLRRDYPVDAGRLILGGFSMGARMACQMALHQTIPAAGFVGMGPWFQGIAFSDEQMRAAAARGLRGYLIVGDQDAGCYPDTLALHERLEAAGVACGLKVYPGIGHVYPDDFAATLGEAVRFILSD